MRLNQTIKKLNNIDLIILCFDISKSDQLSTRRKSKAKESWWGRLWIHFDFNHSNYPTDQLTFLTLIPSSKFAMGWGENFWKENEKKKKKKKKENLTTFLSGPKYHF